ncbi:DUF6221 family protein [Streptomyces sp. NPDC006655]|uniref:DUF6221 family protein n=1 Tax=Streptomyces sp. NPDC006655 TaxID=3156898 RepID=UPI00345719A6
MRREPTFARLDQLAAWHEQQADPLARPFRRGVEILEHQQSAALFRRMVGNRAATDPNRLNLVGMLPLDAPGRWCERHGYRCTVSNGSIGVMAQRSDEPPVVARLGDTLVWNGEKITVQERPGLVTPPREDDAMGELVQWLGDQLDEDERIAQAACWDEWSDVWTARPPQASYERYTVVDYLDDVVVAVTPENADADSVGQHVARHDPARVLREVGAKRQLLDASNADCSPACRRDHTFSGSCALRWMGPVSEIDGEPWVRNEDGRQVPAPMVTTKWTLRLLALSYADRPGYRAEWRP